MSTVGCQVAPLSVERAIPPTWTLANNAAESHFALSERIPHLLREGRGAQAAGDADGGEHGQEARGAAHGSGAFHWVRIFTPGPVLVTSWGFGS